MPNRIIKESICTSDSIDTLGWFEEVLFYRLVVSCDDFGRFDGRVAVVKNRLFPLKEELTLRQVETGLQNLVLAGLVEFYEFQGKPYLFLPSWDEHQSVRAKKSKYPSPESNCLQMHADERKCPRNPNPIQSESLSESNSDETGFDRFWKAYPRKENKKRAREVFAKVREDTQVLIDAVERQKGCEQWRKENGRFIPYAATWLEGERWKDAVEAAPQGRQPDADELEAVRRMMEQ